MNGSVQTSIQKSVALADFLQSPARSLLAYPQSELDFARSQELTALGVTAIFDYGLQCRRNWRCLGLGYFGLVLLVECQGNLAALKARRSDATRDSFEQEAAMLRLANSHQ
ncbi:MAG: serine/threonine protein kinase, partial [Alkalinema sp. RL_2_19]|nr:serine/threonine protein kinase [Alkalinema sp. RL_2_19]